MATKRKPIVSPESLANKRTRWAGSDRTAFPYVHNTTIEIDMPYPSLVTYISDDGVAAASQSTSYTHVFDLSGDEPYEACTFKGVALTGIFGAYVVLFSHSEHGIYFYNYATSKKITYRYDAEYSLFAAMVAYIHSKDWAIIYQHSFEKEDYRIKVFHVSQEKTVAEFRWDESFSGHVLSNPIGLAFEISNGFPSTIEHINQEEKSSRHRLRDIEYTQKIVKKMALRNCIGTIKNTAGDVKVPIRIPSNCTQMVLSDRQTHLAMILQEGVVQLYNLKKPGAKMHVLAHVNHPSISFISENLLLTVSENIPRIWSTETGRMVAILQTTYDRFNFYDTGAASKDGSTIILHATKFGPPQSKEKGQPKDFLSVWKLRKRVSCDQMVAAWQVMRSVIPVPSFVQHVASKCIYQPEDVCKLSKYAVWQKE